MGRCRFCGDDAGLLRREHRECRSAHAQGRKRVVRLVQQADWSEQEVGRLRQEIRQIAGRSYIPAGDLRTLVVEGWAEAVEQALDDHLVTLQEEDRLLRLQEAFNLSDQELDREGALTRLNQGRVLRGLMEGQLPKVKVDGGRAPFNLMKSETLVWVFEDVDYFEEKTRTKFRGGSQGVSFRVAKGVYYRVGGFRGERVQTSETVHADTGLLGATTKHIYFSGDSKHFRIRYDRIVAFTPYANGFGVMRDAQSARPQLFATRDGWFVYNLVTNLAQM